MSPLCEIYMVMHTRCKLNVASRWNYWIFVRIIIFCISASIFIYIRQPVRLYLRPRAAQYMQCIVCLTKNFSLSDKMSYFRHLFWGHFCMHARYSLLNGLEWQSVMSADRFFQIGGTAFKVVTLTPSFFGVQRRKGKTLAPADLFLVLWFII